MVSETLNSKPIRMQLSYLPWILLFISLFTINIKSGIEPASLTAANTLRIILVCCSCFISFSYILTKKQLSRKLFSTPIFLFLSFGIVAIISGVIASKAYYSIWKGIEICADVLAIVLILSDTSQRNSVLMLYRISLILIYFLLFSILMGAIFAPSQAFFPMPRALLKVQLFGVFPIFNPNTVGFISALTFLVCFIRILNANKNFKRLAYIFSITISLATMILAQSRTSFIALTIAIIAYLFFDRRIIIMVLFSACVAALFISSVSFVYLSRGQNMQQLSTMSSRTIAWERAFKLFKESPIIGNGYASASKYDVLGGSKTSTLHGSVFEVLVGVGIVGFIPWFFAIACTGFRLMWPRGNLGFAKRTDIARHIRAEFISVYLMILIRSITSSLLATHDIFFLMFLILCAYSLIDESKFYNDNERNIV